MSLKGNGILILICIQYTYCDMNKLKPNFMLCYRRLFQYIVSFIIFIYNGIHTSSEKTDKVMYMLI